MPRVAELWDTLQLWQSEEQQDPSLRLYAVIGAEQRLLQIADEARAIFQAFPELRAPNRGFGACGGKSPVSVAKAGCPEEGGLVENGRRRKGKRRRRRMSAAARKRISEAQKARWAKLMGREAKGGQARSKQGE